MEQSFLHGFVLALGLILPLGAQNVFVFSQGVVQPTIARALPAVLVAAVSDTILILIAVGGVSLLVLSLDWVRYVLVGIGVVFLSYMGWLTWSTGGFGKELQGTDGQWTVKRQILFAASVSIFNPHAILDTIGVIGTSSLAYTGINKASFTLSCVIVSWLWFFGLAILGRYLRSAQGAAAILPVFNRISAIIMWGCGIYLAFDLFK